MTLTPKYRTQKECEDAGYYWKINYCFRDKEGTMPISMGAFTEVTGIDVGQALMDHGSGVTGTWFNLAYETPPEDFWGRLLWSAGVLGQLILSFFTFPAALAAFLLEEATQTYGMGAYMLSTAKAYDVLENYLVGYKEFIAAAEIGAKSVATLSPITGGAVVIYLQAAKKGAEAFEHITEINLLKQAATDEKTRERELERMKYGEVRLQSSPSNAEIWLDSVNTELLTPETFKRLTVGPHVFEVRKYNKKTEEWDGLIFEVDLEPGRRKEIYARIPIGIKGETEEGEDTDTDEESILPMWIKAEVTGEYAIDGDTFTTSTGERIRILGIDAPEIGRPWADVAKDYLQDQIEDKKIELRILSATPLDTYGRTLAVCKNYKGTIAIFLLSAGLARVDIWKDSPLDRTRYDAAEEQAKTRKVGIWGELP